MNVSLTPELERFVEKTVETGRYNSASEMVRAGLRRIEEEEHWMEEVKGRVARGLRDADAGRLVDAETAVRRMRAAASGKRER